MIKKLPPQHDSSDPIWLRIWKTSGIRWLGPNGDGTADAMDRWKHGFEYGFREGMNRSQLVTLRHQFAIKEFDLAKLGKNIKKLEEELQ